ncbi:MAG: heme ABC transporter permease [Alphaproteobacteria bacterium]
MMTYVPTIGQFQRLSAYIMPWVFLLMAGCFGYGLYLSLSASPPDYLQGESVRIMYIHVPAAWMALGVYTFMAVSSAIQLIWRSPLAGLLAQSAAPIGALFTFICLVTGSLWGKPTWGAWWVWDARLTSVLLLFFFYLGYLFLDGDDEQTSRTRAILAIIGIINIPVVKFSVDWWNTLHQPASIMRFDSPAIHSSMLKPLIVMALGYVLYFLAMLLIRSQKLLANNRFKALQRRVIRSQPGGH